MDVLRARAFLDLLLGKDSRPRQDASGGADGTGPGPGGPGPGGPDTPPPSAGPAHGAAGFAGRVTLTVPLATVTGLADRPGELGGIGPVDPWLARDLAAAAARNPKTTWCVTVTDEHGHAVGHGCARPEPKSSPATRRTRTAAGFTFTPGQPGRPARRLRHLAAAHPRTRAGPDHHPGFPDHRPLRPPAQSPGHDPGVTLKHLIQVRHATCTSPVCRRPAAQCDVEHNTPYEAGGRTCRCNTGPKCRHDHRLKQHPKWKVDQLPDGTFRWTTPSGRSYTTEPTRYPI